jgi:hypothetical protein
MEAVKPYGSILEKQPYYLIKKDILTPGTFLCGRSLDSKKIKGEITMETLNYEVLKKSGYDGYIL